MEPYSYRHWIFCFQEYYVITVLVYFNRYFVVTRVPSKLNNVRDLLQPAQMSV